MAPLTSNYYEILEISQTASIADIKTAFRKAARTNHPDVGGEAEAFRKINEAYETLKDPLKRTAYNRAIGVSDIALVGETPAERDARRAALRQQKDEEARAEAEEEFIIKQQRYQNMMHEARIKEEAEKAAVAAAMEAEWAKRNAILGGYKETWKRNDMRALLVYWGVVIIDLVATYIVLGTDFLPSRASIFWSLAVSLAAITPAYLLIPYFIFKRVRNNYREVIRLSVLEGK